jgi:tetratricopeptide (TPR) repeat protein
VRRDCLFIAALLCLTFAVFWPVGSLGFIGYDDLDYVYQNPAVCSGINPDSVAWAFTTSHAGNWHPVTWLSHMLDCQLFGLNPHEAHWMNLGFHAANTVLLFLWLCGVTQARWRSFFVAALFAVHPLHVQSVAWVAERKDVLSGFFFMLILLSYTRYCRKQTAGNYLLVAVLFALGLMAKSMLVTVPFVLLLLDYWPLRRFDNSSSGQRKEAQTQDQTADQTKHAKSSINPPRAGWPAFEVFKPLLIEKIPLFLLCLIFCKITLWAQSAGGAIVYSQLLPLSNRCLHAVVAYSLYLGKMLWPVNLAIYYPLPLGNPAVAAVLGSLALLIILSLAAFRWRRDQPWLPVGWAWFLVMLLPVIGLVQVGLQSIADRYFYLPSIGLFIAVVWGLGSLAAPKELAHSTHEPITPDIPGTRKPYPPLPGGEGRGEGGLYSQRRMLNVSPLSVPLGILGAVAVLACSLDTRHQLGFWQNNITLFQHVVEVSPKNDYLGYFCLGISYGEVGRFDDAARSLTNALAVNPQAELAQGRLGNVLLLQKKYAAAQPFLESQVRAHPQSIVAHITLGMALAGQQKYVAAQSEYAAALQLNPQDTAVQQILDANAPKADAEQTMDLYANQLAANSTPELHARLAQAEAVLGRGAEAVQNYKLALRQQPDAIEWLNNLAWLLATCPDAAVRDGPEAVRLAQRACELTQYQKTVCLGTLAAACAEAGQFDAAVLNAQKACDRATAQGESDLLDANQRLLKLYQAHQSYHEPVPGPLDDSSWLPSGWLNRPSPPPAR